MAVTRVLPLRDAASGQAAGTVRIEFLPDRTRAILTVASDTEPCAAFLAGQNPAEPVLTRLVRRDGYLEGMFSRMSDVSAFAACASDGRIIYQANRALSAGNLELFRRACRSAHIKGDIPCAGQSSVAKSPQPAAKKPDVTARERVCAPTPVPVPQHVVPKHVASQHAASGIDSLPPPQSEALSDILLVAKQLFPAPEPPALPPATQKSAGRSPSRGVRRTRVQKGAANQSVQAPPLSAPFPKNDVFAASFCALPLSVEPPALPVCAAPVLESKKIPSPFPKSYPDYSFYRVSLPFYRQPRDYCLIGVRASGATVYALPVDDNKKKLPPLCAGAA